MTGTRRRWLPLAAVLALALLVRLPLLGSAALPADLAHFTLWVQTIERYGLLNFYDPELRFATLDTGYPPLSLLGFAAAGALYGPAPDVADALDDPAFVALMKVVPVAADLLLIAAVYLWLPARRRPARWFIPCLLAVTPGFLILSAWWGQYDAPYILALALTLFCLNRDRPRWAWAMFAIAVLIKQPAVILGPLLLVVTFRRYGWRVALSGLAISGGVCLAALAPFALTTGWAGALSPYLKAGSAFPYLTNNAYNLWYALASLMKGGPVFLEEAQFRDALPLVAGISGKTVGMVLFGGFVLFLLAVVWRQAQQRREFVWASALYFGFFMLPTQVHERYLYFTTVFALIAIAQDGRIRGIALALIATFTFNVLVVLVSLRMPDVGLSLHQLGLPVALLNVVLFALTVRLLRTSAVNAPATSADQPPARVASTLPH